PDARLVRIARRVRLARRAGGPGADSPSALVAPPGRDVRPAPAARRGRAGAVRVAAGALREWDGALGWGGPASRRAPRAAPAAAFGPGALARAACRASSHRAAGRDGRAMRPRVPRTARVTAAAPVGRARCARRRPPRVDARWRWRDARARCRRPGP